MNHGTITEDVFQAMLSICTVSGHCSLFSMCRMKVAGIVRLLSRYRHRLQTEHRVNYLIHFLYVTRISRLVQRSVTHFYRWTSWSAWPFPRAASTFTRTVSTFTRAASTFPRTASTFLVSYGLGCQHDFQFTLNTTKALCCNINMLQSLLTEHFLWQQVGFDIYQADWKKSRGEQLVDRHVIGESVI
jgi:hypothetical protein